MPPSVSPRFLYRIDAGALIAALVAGALAIVFPLVGLLAGVGQICQAFQAWNRADLDQAKRIMYLGLLVLWLAFVVVRRVLYHRDDRLTRERYFAGGVIAAMFAALILAFAGQIGLPILNGILDVRAKAPVRVAIESAWDETYRDKDGHSRSTPLARVRRTSAPYDAARLIWRGCALDQKPSRYVDIHLGKGAFGIPWVAFPVVCHPFDLADQPLIGDVFLGRGSPVLLVTVGDAEPVAAPEEDFVEVEQALMQLKTVANDNDAFENRTVLLLTFFGERPQTGVLTTKFRSMLELASWPGTSRRHRRQLLDLMKDDVRARHDAYLAAEAPARQQRLAAPGKWVAAWRAQTHDGPIVVVHTARAPTLPPLDCQPCVIARPDDLDADVAQQIGRAGDLFSGSGQVIVFGPQGTRLGVADLTDTKQSGRLFEALGPAQHD